MIGMRQAELPAVQDMIPLAVEPPTIQVECISCGSIGELTRSWERAMGLCVPAPLSAAKMSIMWKWIWRLSFAGIVQLQSNSGDYMNAIIMPPLCSITLYE